MLPFFNVKFWNKKNKNTNKKKLSVQTRLHDPKVPCFSKDFYVKIITIKKKSDLLFGFWVIGGFKSPPNAFIQSQEGVTNGFEL